MKPENSASPATTAEPDATPTAPRPGWLLVANSVVVMAGSIALVSFFLALSMLIEACEEIVPLVMSFPLAVGWLQYVACFRCSSKAAKLAKAFHLGGFFLVGAFAVTFLLALLKEGKLDADGVLHIAPFAAVAVSAGLGVWTNEQWARVLCVWQARNVVKNSSKRFQVSIRELLLIMAVVALVIGLTKWMIQEFPFGWRP